MKKRISLIFTQPRLHGADCIFVLAITLCAPSAIAANQYFSDVGGPLNWDNTTANWASASSGPYNAVWSSGNAAIFEGTAGTVNVGAGIESPTVGNVTFSVSGYTLEGGQITLGANSFFTQSTSTTTIINSVIGESGGSRTLNFYGGSGSSSFFTLGGANTFTGDVSIRSARVTFDNLKNGGIASSFGAGTGSVSVGINASFAVAAYTGSGGSTDRLFVVGGTGGGTISNNGSGAISFNHTGNFYGGTAGNRSLTLNGNYTSAANTFAETISDMTGYTSSVKVEANTWNITGANTHSGNTTLGSNGVLNIGHATALGTSNFIISGNGSFDNTTGSDLTASNNFTLSGGSPTYIGSDKNMTINGATTISGANRSITVSAKALTLGGAIGEDGTPRSLTKTGAGTLVLAGTTASTYSGGTKIIGGTLAITAANNLGSGTAISFSTSNTATLALDAGATGSVQIPSTTAVTTTTYTANFGNQSTTANVFDIAAKISGNGHVKRASGAISTTGAVRFSNDSNDYTGTFSVGFGLTEFTSVANSGSSSSLGAGSSDYAINNSTSAATLRYVGSTDTSTTRNIDWKATTGGLILENNGNGSVKFLGTGNFVSGDGNKPLTLAGSNTGDNTLAQAIGDGPSSGTTTLVKSGGGKWIVTGANTYSGGTTVSGGTLSVNNTSGSGTGSGNVEVTSGATLSGTGSIAGGVNVSTGSFLAPGNSPGILTLNNGLNLAGTYIWELSALSTSNAGINFDTITLTGGNADIIGATLGLNLGTFTPSADPFWSSDQTWLGILNNTGSGSLTGMFTAIDNSAWSSLGSFSTTVTPGSNDVNLVWTTIPEPNFLSLISGVAFLSLLHRRRD